jgi:anti-sigma regulatory factor (Ser/Thr protein kinase)
MHVRLPCNPASPGLARAFVVGALEREGKTQHREVAMLLVSELVTNAYLHACSPVDVQVQCCGEAVSVAVSDTSPDPAEVVDAMPRYGSNGRGLQLVDALADEWGNEIDGNGKTVWFSLANNAAIN